MDGFCLHTSTLPHRQSKGSRTRFRGLERIRERGSRREGDEGMTLNLHPLCGAPGRLGMTLNLHPLCGAPGRLGQLLPWARPPEAPMRADDLELAAAVSARPLLSERLEAFVEAEEVSPVLLGKAEVGNVLHESLVLPVPSRHLTLSGRRVGGAVVPEGGCRVDGVHARGL